MARRYGDDEVETKTMLPVMVRLGSEESAQDLIEYALLSSLLAVSCITGILQITQIIQFFTDVGAALGNAIP